MEVSRSGYYGYVQRAMRAVDRQEWEVLGRVKAIHRKSGQSYGSRRMAKQLQEEGFAVGRYQARSLMRKAGIAVKQRKRLPSHDR